MDLRTLRSIFKNTSRLRHTLLLAAITVSLLCQSCSRTSQKPHLVIASKFFTEQIILGELLAQHIEARTGIPVERKSNLGGTLLVQKAMLAGDVDLYVEYTGTALTAVLGEAPQGDSAAVLDRVRQQYAQRFHFAVTEPLGFANSFAMVIRGSDARPLHLSKMSDLVSVAPHWRTGVGYEFLERPDGYTGWTQRYGLRFGKEPSVLDLGLLYRALAERKVDVVAGNSTDGLINALGLVPLEDDRHYFPPYDAVPIVREAALQQFPALREALRDLAGKISEADMRNLNKQVDANQRDVRAVVREFRAAKGL